MVDVSLNKLISISEARTRMSTLVANLNKEDYFVITKTGDPTAALISLPLLEELLIKMPLKESKGDLFLNSAGMWKDVDVKRMIKRIYRAREDRSSSKKFLVNTK